MKTFHLLDELDKILALIGVIFSLILTTWITLVNHHPLYIMIGILCFMVCTGYLFIRRFIYPSSIFSLDKLRCSTRFYIILNIFFFLLLSYNIISIYLRVAPYIRPLGYFISIALMAAIVTNEILFLSPNITKIYFALCKIIIIGLSLVYSEVLIFPNVLWIDPWWHQWFTLKILDNAHIPEGLVYSKLPMMHLMIGIISLVTGLNYKLASLLSISSIQIISDALFIFLLGKFLISTKVGLLAALLLEVGNYHIQFAYKAVPNTMAAILILPIIFILLKIRRDKPFIGNLVVLFLMGTLILTHTLTSMFLAILLFVFWLSSLAYTRLFYRETGRPLTWTICILFSTGMLAYWSYISGHIITLANFIRLGFRGTSVDKWILYFSDIPFWEIVFKYIGMFSFFIFSFIGCFYIMSKQIRNNDRFTTTIGGLVILCLAFFPIITGKRLIPGRWHYFSQILLSIPLSLSLFLINGIIRNQFMKGLLMSFSVFALSFILIMSPMANIDNRFFFPNSGFRLAFTESELAGMNTTSRIWKGMIGSDWVSLGPYKYQFNTEFISIDNPLYTGNFSELQDTLIIVREEILNYPFPIPHSKIRIKDDPRIALEEQNFSRIYDSGSLYAYARASQVIPTCCDRNDF